MAVGNPLYAACHRLKTAIAERCNVIAGQSERMLEDFDDYIKRKLPRGTFNPELGPDPRTLRYGFAPAEERAYQPLLTSGFESQDFEGRDCEGKAGTISAQGNAKGAQCHLPGQELQGGWDEFTRHLQGKAFETGWECAMNLLQTHRYNDYLNGLAEAMKREFVKHHCWQLERDVIENAQYNTSCIPGFAMANGAFPAIPTGGLTLETILRLRAIHRAQGAMGAFEVGGLSFEAFEHMRNTYAAQRGFQTEVTPLEMRTDIMGRSTKRVQWADVIWELTEFPLRGTLTSSNEAATGNMAFNPVRPTLTRAGTGGGIVPEINEDYYNCQTFCNGQTEDVFEVAYVVFPTFAEVQSFSMPRVGQKSFESDLFNMALVMHDGGTVTDRFGESNIDNFKFFLRALHAYSFAVQNPEHAGAVIFRASPYAPNPVVPTCINTGALQAVDVAPPNPAIHDDLSQENCETCDSPPADQHVVPAPTADDLCPTNVAGTFRFVDCGPTQTEVDAGILRIGVVREGGSLGAAQVEVNTADNTALAGTDYTAVAGLDLDWADGEAGVKYFDITIDPTGAGGGLNFTATITAGGAPGAAAGNIDADCDVLSINIGA